jgi:hypothetical protein
MTPYEQKTKLIEWDSVKKETLWSYEDLISKLQGVLSYGFVQEHYNHSMRQAQAYSRDIRRGYLQDRGDMAVYIDRMSTYLQKLEGSQVGTYSDLVQQVATRERCAAFLEQTHYDFEPLIQVLNYLMRWVLPFKTPLRELIAVESETELGYLAALKKQKIGSNLDLLEMGRTAEGRNRLANRAEVPLDAVLALVHKADISRLAYVRGKTVRHLNGGGYNTLEKLASADQATMEERMDAYFRSIGKSLADFKSVIPLAWMVGGAKILPRLLRD